MLDIRDLLNLKEAYQAVYNPQELTEEQVWEEVETWVNSLLEEGYDLSDYTWEEMYEEYMSEMGQTRTTGQNSSVFTLPKTPSAGSAGGSGSGGRRGSGRDRNATQTSSSPGALRVKPTAPTPAAPRPAAPAPAAARPAAPAPRQKPAPTPAAPRPAAPAPRQKPAPAPAPAGPKPTATITPTPAAPKPEEGERALTKLPGGNYSSDATSMMSQRTKNILGTTKTPAARPMGSARERMLRQSFDPYDVIKGHLLDEGYADTEEAALAIMINMSEEWKQSIIKSI